MGWTRSPRMTWALRKRWIGIDDRERGMLAMAAIANTGRTDLPDGLLRLASAADLREAVTWGLATRLCRKFSGCIAQTLSGSALGLRDGRLVLAIDAPLRALYTDAVDKDLRLLAGWLEVEPAVDLADAQAAAE